MLDTRHVLTAAHCISTNNASNIRIVGGVHDRQVTDEDKEQFRRGQQFFIHPGWDRELVVNDIAIVRLAEPMQYTRFVQPACLGGSDPKVDSTVVVIGWGRAIMGGASNYESKQTHMKLSAIVAAFGEWRTLKQICLANKVGGESACLGDSGGPLLQQHNGQWYVQGVTSYVKTCRTDGDLLPNVYVRVSAYLHWIKSTIG